MSYVQYPPPAAVYLPPPIFSVDFSSSIVPTIGEEGEFVRGGTSFYYDSPTTAVFAANGVPRLPAYIPGQSKAGIWIGPTLTNMILQSEAPATTWTEEGTPTSVTNGSGTFLDLISYGTIVTDAANEGIKQTISTGYPDTWCVRFIGSLWCQSASGTVPFTITLTNQAAETIVSSGLAATTTPQRLYVYGTWATAATTVEMKITLDSAGTLRLGGMMLEDAGFGGFVSELSIPTNYIKTTTEAATVSGDVLTYPASAISQGVGTAVVWSNVPYTPAQIIDTNETKQWLASGSTFTHGRRRTGSDINLCFLYGAHYQYDSDTTWTANTWYCNAVTWNNAGPLSWAVYENGTLVSNGNQNTESTPSATALTVGAFSSGTQKLNGIISQIEMFDEVLTPSQILALYNRDLADHT